MGGPNGTQTDPKTIKNRSEKSKVKKTDPRRSWARLGAILGRLGCHLGALETLWHYACRCFVNIHFFDVKTVQRRSWDQLWPTKAPKEPNMTPKTEPKSTPRRSKINAKIDIKKQCQNQEGSPSSGPQTLGRDPPPWEPLGGLPGVPGGGVPAQCLFARTGPALLVFVSFFMLILMSIFDRLGVDLGSVLGVIFGRFGALVGQSWSQDRL